MLCRRGTGAFNKSKSDNPQMQDESVKYSLRDTEKRIRTQRNQIQGTTLWSRVHVWLGCVLFRMYIGKFHCYSGWALAIPKYTKDRKQFYMYMYNIIIFLYVCGEMTRTTWQWDGLYCRQVERYMCKCWTTLASLRSTIYITGTYLSMMVTASWHGGLSPGYRWIPREHVKGYSMPFQEVLSHPLVGIECIALDGNSMHAIYHASQANSSFQNKCLSYIVYRP